MRQGDALNSGTVASRQATRIAVGPGIDCRQRLSECDGAVKDQAMGYRESCLATAGQS